MAAHRLVLVPQDTTSINDTGHRDITLQRRFDTILERQAPGASEQGRIDAVRTFPSLRGVRDDARTREPARPQPLQEARQTLCMLGSVSVRVSHQELGASFGRRAALGATDTVVAGPCGLKPLRELQPCPNRPSSSPCC